MLNVFQKPRWASVMSEEDSRNQTRLSLIILSIVLQIQLVNANAFWVVIIWIFGVFFWLGNMYDGGFSPGGGRAPVTKIVLHILRRHWRETS